MDKKTIGDWIMYYEVQLSSHPLLTPVSLLFAPYLPATLLLVCCRP